MTDLNLSSPPAPEEIETPRIRGALMDQNYEVLKYLNDEEFDNLEYVTQDIDLGNGTNFTQLIGVVHEGQMYPTVAEYAAQTTAV